MARLASQSKGGFYATPPEMVDLVCRRLSVEKGKLINLLDVCCGEGDALNQIQLHLDSRGAITKSYGNELEVGRYEEAKKKLDHVINGGYEGVRSSPYHTFSWLNPPYDNAGKERMEAIALRHQTTRNDKQILQSGAVICFCIPQEILEKVAARVAQRLNNVSVYRFTDPFYDRFKQVVVFGYFLEPSEEQFKETNEYLKNVALKGPNALPPLDINDGKVYKIPPALRQIEHFRGELTVEELVRDLEGTQIFREAMDMFMPPSVKRESKLKRPPLPLKLPHIAMAITANALDGNMGDFWLSGYTVTESETVYIENEKGEIVREEVVYRPVPVARIFSPKDGILELK